MQTELLHHGGVLSAVWSRSCDFPSHVTKLTYDVFNSDMLSDFSLSLSMWTQRGIVPSLGNKGVSACALYLCLVPVPVPVATTPVSPCCHFP